MTQSQPDLRRFAFDLATIAAELNRAEGRPEAMLAVGERLSLLGTEVAAACERAFVDAFADAAA